MGGYFAAFDLGDRERELSWEEYVLTANAAFCTDTLRSMGGFDQDLGPREGVYRTNEDVDLCRRLMVRAGPMRYVPTAVVVHEMTAARLRIRYLVRRMYIQGRSDWVLDRRVLGDSFLDGFVMLAWPRLAYVGRLCRYEGILHRAVVLRAFCELARAAGMLVEAARASWARSHEQEAGADRANTA
jgi:GT2 family glycosyltransferase